LAVSSPQPAAQIAAAPSEPLVALVRGEVHAWYARVDEAADDAAVHALASILSPEEQARRARFVFARDRRLYLTAHVLLRTVLSRYAAVGPADWRFEEDPQGKPRIAAPAGVPALRFNLSHARGLAAVGVGLVDEVGLDVEQIAGLYDRELARTCFTDEELAWLESAVPLDRNDRFTDLWTLKEAYLKARGTGLALPLHQFSVRPRDAYDAGIAFDAALGDDPAAWQFRRFCPAPGYRMAVALQRRSDAPLHVEWREWSAA